MVMLHYNSLDIEESCNDDIRLYIDIKRYIDVGLQIESGNIIIESEVYLLVSRLTILTKDKAQVTMESLYQDLERRIVASPPGLCPVDLTRSFIKMCLAQSCGKCVPCRVGLRQLARLFDNVLDGEANEETVENIKLTAEGIYYSADCAIGYEAAKLALKSVDGCIDDFESHIHNGFCSCNSNQPVACVKSCPAGVDIPGYIALVQQGRYADAVRLIRRDNPMPTTCAYICEHPCENRCKRTIIDAPVNIRGLLIIQVLFRFQNVKHRQARRLLLSVADRVVLVRLIILHLWDIRLLYLSRESSLAEC